MPKASQPATEPQRADRAYRLPVNASQDGEVESAPVPATRPGTIPRLQCFRKVRHRKKRRMLEALVWTGGNVSRAARLVGVCRSSPDLWRLSDPQFANYWAMAKRMGSESLEDEAIRRAVDGLEVPVGFHKGEPSAFVTQYSDTLLIFLLKGAFPEKYADRMELKGAMANIDMSRLPDEAVHRIAGGEHPNSVILSLAQEAQARGFLPAPGADGPKDPMGVD